MKNNNSIVANLLFGLILFFGSFALLWWNEGNSAKNIATASYVRKKAVQIESTQILESNNNEIVAVSGSAVTNSTLKDVNIRVPEALVLERTVKMYQWKEEQEEDSNGNDRYEYTKVWSKAKINSDHFHDKRYKNPDFPLKSKGYYADRAKLGAFDLELEQIKKIVPEEEIYDLPENKKYSIEDGRYYSGKDILSPEIGDILISYSYAPSGTKISLIGKQESNHIKPFHYKNRYNYIQYNGSLNKEEIIKRYEDENFVLTMTLRIVGWLMMFIGLKLLISPIEKIFGFVPILGQIADNISSLIIMLITLVLSLITIAIAWFVYRPFLSILLITISLGIAKIIRDKQANKIN